MIKLCQLLKRHRWRASGISVFLISKISKHGKNRMIWTAIFWRGSGTLLHEHHDFFLASQHPSASSALSKLAAKYSMPARVWRHGIHAFLEVLRHRLPDSTVKANL